METIFNLTKEMERKTMSDDLYQSCDNFVSFAAVASYAELSTLTINKFHFVLLMMRRRHLEIVFRVCLLYK